MIPSGFADQLRRTGSVVLTLKVVPKASRDEIVGLLDDGALKVKVTAAPDRGKANAAVCEILADAFGVPKRNVEILRGETSHTKQVRVTA